jgi:anti-sigma factor (TIGR02949 family)
MKAPQTIDCHAAANRLYDYLDGELTAEVEATVRAHLAACAVCFKLFEFEEAYLAFLRARTRAKAAPDHLRRQVFERVLYDRDRTESE